MEESATLPVSLHFGNAFSAPGTRRPVASAISRHARPIYCLLGIEFGLIAMLVAGLRFRYNGQDIDLVAATLALSIGVALLLRWRGFARAANAIEASALMLLSGMTVACLSVLFATLSMPYRDQWLEGLDHWLFSGLSWPAMVAALAPHHRLVAAMCWTYNSLLWQPFVAILLLAACGRDRMLWRFLHAWLLALLVSVVIFAFFPAVTAYVHYGIPEAQVPAISVHAGWRPARILAGIRGGSIHELGTASMAGLITFPSFHAAGATLLAWAFRALGRIGAGLVALNLAMLLVVPMIGSHYFVDVVGGIGVALLAIAATRPAPDRAPQRRRRAAPSDGRPPPLTSARTASRCRHAPASPTSAGHGCTGPNAG